MRKLSFLIVLASLMLAGCSDSGDSEQVASGEQEAESAANETGAGDTGDRENDGEDSSEPVLDTSEYSDSIEPQDDFWAFANGDWVHNTEIPSDKARWGSFLILRERAQEDVREIIDELAQAEGLVAGSPGQKIRDFYHSFMQVERIDDLGVEPIAADLETIGAIDSKQKLAELFGEAGRMSVPRPLSFWVNQDSKDTDRYIAYFSQSGLGLPDRDYYFDEGEKFDRIRSAYREYAAKLFDLAGIEAAASTVDAIYNLEKALAEHQWTRVESRDRDKTYNKLTREEVTGLAPQFGWDAFLGAAGLSDQEQLVVRQPSYVEGFGEVFESTPLAVWKQYMRLRLLDTVAEYLSDDFYQAYFDFHEKTLSGKKSPPERWKRAVDTINATIGELVGKEYVKRHFPPRAKQRMESLVANLQVAMRQSLEDLSWMTEQTRQEALDKLDKFTAKIGYPDKWHDYSNLQITPDSLVENLRRTAEFQYRDMIDKLDEPIREWEWFMNPQTVNAYYNPWMNEIVFPAAILQPPFFHLEADDAVNYGAIGAVIGHEIGHGFDDQGRKSDGDGVLRDWWTEQDAEQYQTITDRLVAQYEQFEPIKGMNINGRLTLGENIGDLGGLTLAWRAYQESLEGKPQPEPKDGFTHEQRFFLSYAQIWRAKAREQFLMQQLKTDPHSPPQYRVMGTLPNFDPFYAAFNVEPGDGMYLPPEQRVGIW